MTEPVTRRLIPEVVVEGKRLGRHVEHDPRSLAYQVQPDGTVRTIKWDRVIEVLDQGNVGSCTGNAATGHLGTQPEDATLAGLIAAGLTLNEAEALKLYSAAEVIDGNGPYPPSDFGSSGLSVAKAAKNAGLISGYLHMTSLAAVQTAIQSGPVIIGVNWYEGFDSPNSAGLVSVSGSVRGGHEFEVIGYDTQTDLWEAVNSWGTSYGVSGRFFFSSATFSRLLSEQGDATQFVPLSKPVPVPTPVPGPNPPPGPPPFPVPTPTPPVPTPTPAPVASSADLRLWNKEAKAFISRHHIGPNHDLAMELEVWAEALGLLAPHTPEHSAS